MAKKIIVFLAIVVLVTLAGCAPNSGTGEPTATTRSGTPTTIWDGLASHQPISYGTPLPPAHSSPIDGLYGRLLDRPPQWWRCLRCADYRVSGGLWRLQFDKGVMRIYYDITSWRAIASFRVEGDKLFIFNDSTCIQNGEYRWQLDQGSLTLLPIGQDDCYFGLRGKNLSSGVWELCPSDRNAADAPLGCGDRASFEPLEATELPVRVTLREGDVRRASRPLDVVAVANKENIPSPEGIQISYAPGSAAYGVNRVLWWGGDWIEAKTGLPFKAMGVQFYGSSSIGWASVFFDDVEVWRGDVAAIWDHFGSYGGYIEVSGYEPGAHTLRVQLVEGDYRPLTIAVFGFTE